MESCVVCEDPGQFRHLRIKEYSYWRLELHENQVYLGWCVIIPKRHIEDLIELTVAEREELWSIIEQSHHALGEAFHPDKFNYAALGNIFPHLHVQIIPRYIKERVFQDITFKDERWGKNYSPYNKEFSLSSTFLQTIVREIKKYL